MALYTFAKQTSTVKWGRFCFFVSKISSDKPKASNFVDRKIHVLGYSVTEQTCQNCSYGTKTVTRVFFNFQAIILEPSLGWLSSGSLFPEMMTVLSRLSCRLTDGMCDQRNHTLRINNRNIFSCNRVTTECRLCHWKRNSKDERPPCKFSAYFAQLKASERHILCPCQSSGMLMRFTRA